MIIIYLLSPFTSTCMLFASIFRYWELGYLWTYPSSTLSLVSARLSRRKYRDNVLPEALWAVVADVALTAKGDHPAKLRWPPPSEEC